MFSLDGHPSALVPIDPATSTTVVATLGAGAAGDEAGDVVGGPAGDAADEAEAAVAAPPAAQAQAAVADDRGAEKARAAAKRERTAKKAEKRTARAEPAPAAKSGAKSGAMGTLKIGAKPPCDILIDGKRTGLVTPQAALKLSAGKHTITLVNKEHGIKEQLKVTIEAGETTKVIKDLTSRM